MKKILFLMGVSAVLHGATYTVDAAEPSESALGSVFSTFEAALRQRAQQAKTTEEHYRAFRKDARGILAKRESVEFLNEIDGEGALSVEASGDATKHIVSQLHEILDALKGEMSKYNDNLTSNLNLVRAFWNDTTEGAFVLPQMEENDENLRKSAAKRTLSLLHVVNQYVASEKGAAQDRLLQQFEVDKFIEEKKSTTQLKQLINTYRLIINIFTTLSYVNLGVDLFIESNQKPQEVSTTLLIADKPATHTD